MDMLARIQQALDQELTCALSPSAPPRLMAAMRHAVFPGGARIRPQLCMAVAQACGDDAPELTDAAAAAIELLHCASLVHDDMPCFDDADLRRGLPSVHKLHGEPLALLSGDGLIVMAFQAMARVGARHPERLSGLLGTLCSAAGAPDGIVAGQAWECEPRASLSRYQRAKTGALFVAATCAGAQAAGADPSAWRNLGDCLGEAYQVADDIRDVMLGSDELGKPSGQDVQHHRPSAADDLGLAGALGYFQHRMQEAVDAVPDCAHRDAMRALVLQESARLIPPDTRQRIATRARPQAPGFHATPLRGTVA
ncbi:polyprenyl synthetase family protein [Hydrogenophaga sp.]|jgi:geranylgeranyl diphosphate synthase type II|uniref:polyprenyl synthetase family protein n=1 Tax=Hydrogenophaga sp. TaxID=1904254 RepID=UPI001E17CA2D|nr:polyprenyl synthetase family protein [Hydrogenophaga sp.]MBW0183011.1 polyprenyl synthetase family protein [Hydrogenophaga sp.]